MKLKWWIAGGLVVVVIALVILSATGVINLSWQDFTMIAAALAAPFKFIFDKLGGADGVDELLDKHEKMRKEEAEYRKKMDGVIAEKEQRIINLNKDLELQDAKLQLVEEKKKRVDQEVKSMSIAETKSEAQDLFGE